MKKVIQFTTMLVCVLFIAAIFVAAEGEITVLTDGYPYDGSVILYHDTAYVSFREFSAAVDNAVVWWEKETETAVCKTDYLTVYVTEGGKWIDANERLLWCEYGTFTTEDGVMLVPLTAISKAFGFDHTWDSDTETVYLVRESAAIVPATEYYDETDIYWLSRIIHAEAQGEPLHGKIAVGEVVLNRVRDEDFPDTVYDVIFDNTSGVQFSPTANGAIDNIPGEESIAAAKICLEGIRIHNDNILYFLNPTIAVSMWIPQNRTYACTIGNHDFYT